MIAVKLKLTQPENGLENIVKVGTYMLDNTLSAPTTSNSKASSQ